MKGDHDARIEQLAHSTCIALGMQLKRDEDRELTLWRVIAAIADRLEAVDLAREERGFPPR